ncbi:MAG: cell wall-associated hydrolase, invasion-associated protein [Actinomycetia bacterium]|jgi:cell wall-associated NlpC family hydrolase|nr:cell wall-associated hydrolase, invasion-associated protein [Actinomycetes bacterium]
MSRRNVSHRGAGIFGARHLTLGLALGLALSVTAIASPAGATPQSDLASKTAQAKQLEATIEANSQRADVLDEQYLQAQAAVADANRQIVSAEQGIASARAQVSGLRRRLGGRAARLYIGAGSGDPLGIDATNVQELGSRAKYGAAAAETDNKMIDQLRVLDEQLRRQETALQQQKADAQKRQDAAEAAHREVEKISSKMSSLLASTKSDIVSLARKIETDRIAAQAAAERARIQAQAAQQAAAAQATSGGGGSSSNFSTNPADTGINPGSIPAPSSGASAAIAYARAQIGKPYVYAGAGPGAFDCSGLTMMAWAQGGVSMSHGSQSQWASFPKVPIPNLQPGDLVFFGSSGPSNHHVGLYIGGGTMIEAPHTGAFVRYSSIYRPDLVSTGSRP